MAYIAGGAIRFATNEVVLAPAIAALALLLWVVWAARRHPYAPLTAIPLGAGLALWSHLDLGLDAGPERNADLQLGVHLLAGVPALIVAFAPVFAASLLSSRADPARPSLFDAALRGAAWLVSLATLVLLVAAARSFRGRPTPAQYFAAIPVVVTLPPIAGAEPQDSTIGRFSVRRRRIDTYCVFSIDIDREAPEPKLSYTHDSLDQDDGTPQRIANIPHKDCGSIVLRPDHAHGLLFFEAAGSAPRVYQLHPNYPCETCPHRVADATGPLKVTLAPPVLGLAIALLALTRRPRRPGGERSRLVEGEFDDEVGKLYLNDRQTPIPWRDPHAPTGRVVAVLAPAQAEVGGSFRTSARESAKVAALLPGRIADIGHEERTRAACLALSAALLSAVPLAMAGWNWWSW